jgi:hypothetical protein
VAALAHREGILRVVNTLPVIFLKTGESGLLMN